MGEFYESLENFVKRKLMENTYPHYCPYRKNTSVCFICAFMTVKSIKPRINTFAHNAPHAREVVATKR
jgi:hypothetical protein